MTLAAGSHLGPYEILGPLGAGGMGEVYKARDTRLDRTVAVKVLATHLSANPELRQRFEREARAISSLSHPHICTLHDVGHQDGVDFLVMEHLEGESLAQRLQRGPIPIEQVLRLGVEIASALDAAHRSGITHRDLKPGNIVISRAGAKLLDFGLAKTAAGPVAQPDMGSLTSLPTEVAGAAPLTAEGTLLGTFQYMAPEQLEGKEADARTDIFAFGAVLYEMVTSKPAFTGGSRASMISSIMSAQPQPVTAVQPLTPPALERLIRTCLAKDPDDRWQTAHDVALQLQWIAEGGSAVGLAPPVSRRRARREHIAWAVAGVAVIAAALFAWRGMGAGSAPARAIRFTVPVPGGVTDIDLPRISPDGTTLAFAAVDSSGKSMIWLRPLNSLTANPLPGTEDAIRPFWSPDSRFIGFVAGGKLKKIAVAGGPAEVICDAPSGSDGSWSGKDVILFDGNASVDPIRRVGATGGVATAALPFDSTYGVGWPAFLPDDKHYFFTKLSATGQELMIGSLGSKKVQRLGIVASRVEYSPDGYVLFVRDRTLLAQRFNAGSLKLEGDPFPVAESLPMASNAQANFSVSDNGVLVYRSVGAFTSRLVWLDRTGREVGQIGASADYRAPALSPDGRLVAIRRQDAQGASSSPDVWIMDPARGTTTRFTFDPGADSNPLWSPDGSQIAFYSDRKGEGVWLKSSSGLGKEEPLVTDLASVWPEDWSRDGKYLLYSARDDKTRTDIWMIPMTGDRKPQLVLQTPFQEFRSQFSPDNRWIAYESNESGKSEVYVASFQGTAGKWQVSTAGGSEPHWRRDGRELFYLSADQRLMSVAVTPGPTFTPGVPQELFRVRVENGPRNTYCVGPDGQRFLFLLPNQDLQTPMNLMVNWRAGLGEGSGMSLAPDRVLSNYRLLSRLGEGGMGVVWRATDTSLGRDVAIKVLPDLFAHDAERLARFEREARLLASLNHPNIASIFGLHSAEGVRFLAMELVEGEDLAARIARGPIPLAEALPIALQVAEALEFAHERGVIHRDLKPANIALDAGSRVKVLDFGLAKALEGDVGTVRPVGLSQSPTITGMLTSAHVLLGTAAYMSPEQARAQAVDRRADIWAFGVVLFEMLTGRQVFQGDTVSDTLASVLKSEPEWPTLPADVPPRVRRLLRRCLERDARKRLRDIGEARIALEQAIAGAPDEAAPAVAATASPPAARGLPRLAMAGGALVIGALLAFAGAWLLRPAARAIPLRKFMVAVTSSDSDVPRQPAISPDGREVAYLSGQKLMVRDLSGLEAKAIETPKDITAPFWSPDAKFIGFISGTRIMKVPVAGGASETVSETHDVFTGGQGATWLADGTIAFSRGDSMGIMQVPALGGDPMPLIPTIPAEETDLHEPWALPGGRGILFLAHRRHGGINNIGVWSRGKRKVLLTLSDESLAFPSYSPTGHVLFQRTRANPGIWALPFSLSRLEATGAPFLVAPEAGRATTAGDGTLFYRSGGAAGTLQMTLVDPDGKELAAVGEPRQGADFAPGLSRDGRLAANAVAEASNTDLWVQDVVRGTRTRLTFDLGPETTPDFSPTGDRVVYQSRARDCTEADCWKIVVRPSDGTGVADTLGTGIAARFTPDGKDVVFSPFRDGGVKWDLVWVSLEGGSKPMTIVTGNPRAYCGSVCPDGRYMAYMSTESGDWQVFLTRFPSGESKWQVSSSGGQWPRWNARGDRLYFLQGDDAMEVEVGGGASPALGTPKKLFTRPSIGVGNFGFYPGWGVTADGSKFLILKSSDSKGVLRGLTVVQNWFAEFDKRK